MFDADHFKAINVAHGHAAGDAVWRRLAELFGRTFRQIDVPARIGGEEFAVLLPPTQVTSVTDLIKRADGALYAAKSAGRSCIVRQQGDAAHSIRCA